MAAPQVNGQHLVYLLDTLQGPAELHSVRADGRDAKTLTRINEQRLATVRLGASEQFTFTGAGGETVHAWVVKPADFDPARKYPVAPLIDGGPAGIVRRPVPLSLESGRRTQAAATPP